MSLRMPAIWSSSQRPISVRTVWVDGVRHAILSPDDPIVRQIRRHGHRPTTSRSCDVNCSRTYREEDDLYESDLRQCFVNLHVVVDEVENVVDSSPENTTSRIVLKSGTKASRKKKTTAPHFYSGTLKDAEPEVEVEVRLPEIQQNSLSERVLQWLDISGRVKHYQRDDTTVPASQRRKNLDQRRGSSAIVTKDRIVVKNYTLHTQQDAKDDKEKVKLVAGRKERASSSYFVDKSQSVKLFEEDCTNGQETGQSLWSPPKKPQLHIFMPSLSQDDKIEPGFD